MSPDRNQVARELLAFYLEAGVDAVLGETAVDRFADTADISPPPAIGQLRGARVLVGGRIAEPHVDGLGRLTQPRKGAARRADDDGQKLDPVRSWRQDSCGQVLAKLLDRISSGVGVGVPTDARRRCNGRGGGGTTGCSSGRCSSCRRGRLGLDRSDERCCGC